MCGRFALTATPDAVQSMLGVMELDPFPPRYNIAPTQPILMALSGPSRAPGSNLPSRSALLVRWGLIPSWAKNPADLPLLFNARSETAAQKASFKTAMRHRRALVPASGFYEWRRLGNKRAEPYWIRPRHGGVIAFAGLMESWSEPGGTEMDTGAILTTEANARLKGIHHRMPVVIEPQDFERWLDCLNQEPRHVADLLKPAEPDFFEAIPVSDKVNKVANAGPELQDRAERPADAITAEKKSSDKDDQLTLF
ncbi:SOS response-associated peptidase [Nitratireductor indicus]|uniref:SOS response-associated peptidase n=1 Tax=Nitratireductor indicus TaxID=721133 RepID=UPI0028749C54|nr:SOS response-associated peptidase [Nitratireductor indicus]MDS1134698.1 SOS response-associated peptidase [Nitratireductor indicus]